MRTCEFVDEWYVLRTTQNGEFVCLSVSRDRHTSCAVLRAVAQLAQGSLVERSFPFVFSSQL